MKNEATKPDTMAADPDTLVERALAAQPGLILGDMRRLAPTLEDVSDKVLMSHISRAKRRQAGRTAPGSRKRI